MNAGSMLTIVLHSVTAAVFFFALQRYLMDASLQTSLVWGLAGALGAGYLAWQQSRKS